MARGVAGGVAGIVAARTPRLSWKFKLALALLALLGVVLILVASSNYGAGVSLDSVRYIATARNTIAGVGFVDYDGSPTTRWPPLYSALLALVGEIFSLDPLVAAPVVNAIIFGLCIYLGGLVAYRYSSLLPPFAIVGGLAVLITKPLLPVAVMAWSEPLFIFFMLASLYSAKQYLENKDLASLLLLASAVALACLTRYIGVTLILWGMLILCGFQPESIRRKIERLVLFLLVSALPLGIWAARNFMVSGTFLGPRQSSTLTLAQNLDATSNTILHWYLPQQVPGIGAALFLVCAAVGVLALVRLGGGQTTQAAVRRIGPMLLFTIIYTVFLVISSTVTAYDVISDRLLSPIYVPLTLSLLILLYAIAEPYKRRFGTRVVNAILIAGVAVWFILPLRATAMNAGTMSQAGQGYTGRAWRESWTAQYLAAHPMFESECAIYTNEPFAVYILAQRVAKFSPARTINSADESLDENGSAQRAGRWPQEGKACLVWFSAVGGTRLLSPQELQAVASLDQIAEFQDGTLYHVTGK